MFKEASIMKGEPNNSNLIQFKYAYRINLSRCH